MLTRTSFTWKGLLYFILHIYNLIGFVVFFIYYIRYLKDPELGAFATLFLAPFMAAWKAAFWVFYVW